MRSDVAAYFDAVPGKRVTHMTALHGRIISLYPNANIDMTYKMPTYRHGDGWVALANQQRYVSLHPCDAVNLVEFVPRYPNIKTGKGCINFRQSDILPPDGVEQVIRHATDHPKRH